MAVSCTGWERIHSPLHETATCRCDVTRGCVMQFWPPDDEHMSSKHVEAWNKLTVKQKFCASSWLITEINIHRTVLISKLFSKIMNRFTAVKNLSPFHFASRHFLFFIIFMIYHVNSPCSVPACWVRTYFVPGFVWIQNRIKYYTVQCVVYFVTKHRMKFSTWLK